MARQFHRLGCSWACYRLNEIEKQENQISANIKKNINDKRMPNNSITLAQLPWHLVDVMVTMAGFAMVIESETRLQQIRVSYK